MALKMLILALNLAVLVAVVALYRRVKRMEPKRRVEAPNSEYRSRYVEDIEARERWERLDLDRMHQVNRTEVERILSKIKAASIRSVSEADRAFLERMVEAERRLSS